MGLPMDGDEAANIIYDQRKLNLGRPEGQFELFYAELDSMLEELDKAAEERRASMAAQTRRQKSENRQGFRESFQSKNFGKRFLFSGAKRKTHQGIVFKKINS